MAPRDHSTIPSNLTQEQSLDSDTGILHASSSDTQTLTVHYWITNQYILPTFTQDIREAVYNTIYFTPFSSEAVWICLYPENPISNTIYV